MDGGYRALSYFLSLTAAMNCNEEEGNDEKYLYTVSIVASAEYKRAVKSFSDMRFKDSKHLREMSL